MAALFRIRGFRISGGWHVKGWIAIAALLNVLRVDLNSPWRTPAIRPKVFAGCHQTLGVMDIDCHDFHGGAIASLTSQTPNALAFTMPPQAWQKLVGSSPGPWNGYRGIPENT